MDNPELVNGEKMLKEKKNERRSFVEFASFGAYLERKSARG